MNAARLTQRNNNYNNIVCTGGTHIQRVDNIYLCSSVSLSPSLFFSLLIIYICIIYTLYSTYMCSRLSFRFNNKTSYEYIYNNTMCAVYQTRNEIVWYNFFFFFTRGLDTIKARKKIFGNENILFFSPRRSSGRGRTVYN